MWSFTRKRFRSRPAGIDHLTDSGDAISEFDDFKETESAAQATLSFSLFEGGSKLSRLSVPRGPVGSVLRSAIEIVDQQIHAAFAQVSGAYANIGFAARQEDAARRNYEFVYEVYVLGVASILDFLDAQSQTPGCPAGLGRCSSRLLQGSDRRRAGSGLLPFLEPDQEVEEVLMSIESQRRTRP
jgi:hypothetical protein